MSVHSGSNVSKKTQHHMSRVARKPVFGFLTRSDTKRAVQPQKITGDFIFRIKKVEGLYYVAKAKALISCTVTVPLFSHMQKAGFQMTRLICNIVIQ